MKYIELNIETGGNGVELIETELMEMGIDEFVIDDPAVDEEMKNWTQDTDYPDLVPDAERVPKVTVYLNVDQEGMETVRQITERMRKLKTRAENGEYGEDTDVGALSVTTEVRGDEEWKDKWKEFFKPVHITDRIVVCPTWEKYEAESDSEIIIRIDPGMAFGTGTHETTRLTAGLIEKYLKPGDAVLDVGCGSGILSIIAEKLGAGDVLGIDIDEDAVGVAKENCRLNGSGPNIRMQVGDLTEGVDFKANLIAANLLTHLVIRLSSSVPSHLVPGGVFVTSGILADQQKQVTDCLEELGFEILDTPVDGEWCGVAARMRK